MELDVRSGAILRGGLGSAEGRGSGQNAPRDWTPLLPFVPSWGNLNGRPGLPNSGDQIIVACPGSTRPTSASNHGGRSAVTNALLDNSSGGASLFVEPLRGGTPTFAAEEN